MKRAASDTGCRIPGQIIIFDKTVVKRIGKDVLGNV